MSPGGAWQPLSSRVCGAGAAPRLLLPRDVTPGLSGGFGEVVEEGGQCLV